LRLIFWKRKEKKKKRKEKKKKEKKIKRNLWTQGCCLISFIVNLLAGSIARIPNNKANNRKRKSFKIFSLKRKKKANILFQEENCSIVHPIHLLKKHQILNLLVLVHPKGCLNENMSNLNNESKYYSLEKKKKKILLPIKSTNKITPHDHISTGSAWYWP